MRYSVDPRKRIYVKGNGFMSLQEILVINIVNL